MSSFLPPRSGSPDCWLLALFLCIPFRFFAQSPGDWYAVTTEGNTPKAVYDGSAVAVGDQLYLLGGYSRQPVMRFDPETERWKKMVSEFANIHHFQPVVVEGRVFILGAYYNSPGRERALTDVLTYDPLSDQLRTVGQVPSGRARGSAAAVAYEGSIYLLGGARDKEGASVAWADRYDPAEKSWSRLPDAPHARDHFQAHVVGSRIYLVGGATNGVPQAAVDVYDLAEQRWLTATEVPPGPELPRTQAVSAVLDSQLYLIGGYTTAGKVTESVSVLNVARGTWHEEKPLIRGRRSAGAAVLNDRIYVATGLQSAETDKIPTDETYLEFFALGDIGRRPFDDWAVLQAGNYVRAEGIMVPYDEEFYWFNGFAPDLQQQAYNEKYDPATDTWCPIAQIPDAADGSIQYGTHTSVALIDSSIWFAGNRIGTDPGLVQNSLWIYDIPADSWRKGPELPMPTGAGGLARVGDEVHYIGGFDEYVSCEVDYHWVYDLKHPDLGWQDHTPVTPMPMARLHFGTVVLGTKIYVVGGQFGHNGCLGGKNTSLVHVFDTETDTWSRLADMPGVNSHFEPGIFAYNDKIYRVGGQDASSEETWEYDIATDTWKVRTDLRVPERLIAAGARPYRDNLYVSLGGFKLVGNPRNRVWVKSFDPLTSYRLALHPDTLRPEAYGPEGQRIVLANYASGEPAAWSVDTTGWPDWLQLDRTRGIAVQSATEIVATVDTSALAPGSYAYDLSVVAPGYQPATWSVRFAVSGSGVTDPPPTDTTVVDPPPTDTTVIDPPPTDTTVVDPPPTDTTVVDPPPTDTTVVDPPPTDTTVIDPPPTDTTVVDPPPTDTTVIDPPPTDTTVIDPPPTDTTVNSDLPLSRYYDAECAAVGSNWRIYPDASAGAGAYVVAADGYESKKTAPADTPENYIRFRLEVATDSSYHLYGRLNAPSRSEDSYWYRLDSGTWRSWYKDLTTYGEWDWREIPESPYNLTAGDHYLDIAFREKNTQLDRIYLSPSDTIPAGTGFPDLECGEKSHEMAMFQPAVHRVSASHAPVPWSLYPNPAVDYVNVVLPDPNMRYKSLTISDVNGRVVRVLSAEMLAGQAEIRIEIGALPAGLYRVRLGTEQSDSSRTFVRVY